MRREQRRERAVDQFRSFEKSLAQFFTDLFEFFLGSHQ
jgi:hypothetical protein